MYAAHACNAYMQCMHAIVLEERRRLDLLLDQSGKKAKKCNLMDSVQFTYIITMLSFRDRPLAANYPFASPCLFCTKHRMTSRVV